MPRSPEQLVVPFRVGTTPISSTSARTRPYGGEVDRGQPGQSRDAVGQPTAGRPRAQAREQPCAGVVHVQPGEVDQEPRRPVLGEERADRLSEEERAGLVRDRAAVAGRTADSPATAQHASARRMVAHSTGQAVQDGGLQHAAPTVRRRLHEPTTGLTDRTGHRSGPSGRQRPTGRRRGQRTHPVRTDQYAHGRSSCQSPELDAGAADCRRHLAGSHRWTGRHRWPNSSTGTGRRRRDPDWTG